MDDPIAARDARRVSNPRINSMKGLLTSYSKFTLGEENCYR